MERNMPFTTGVVIPLLILINFLHSWVSAEPMDSEKVAISANQYGFKTAEPIYVIGDIRGTADEIVDTLTRLKLVNEKGEWIGGKAHIVTLGDFMGEGSSTTVLELFKGLQEQAKSVGGQFHVLLGDRELQHIIDQVTTKKSFLSVAHLQWLINLPFVIQINDQVFTHGGLSKNLMHLSIKELNQTLAASLISYFNQGTSDITQIQSVKPSTVTQRSNNQLLFTQDNPVLYKGNAICHPYFEADNLTNILVNWSAVRLWVSHSSTKQQNFYSRLNKQLMMVDSDLNQPIGEPLWVAKIDTDKKAALINSETREKRQAQVAAKRTIDNPYSMTEQQIEEFLKTAEIIHRKALADGVTKPIQMTLQKDEKQLKAVFKYVDSRPGKERKKWQNYLYEDDRFFYDIAAYKLDRLLDIGLVPVVVERSIDGKRGILQLWINDLVSKKTLKEKAIHYEGHCDYKDQINMMDTFDYLIRNTDRNQSNILYSKSDWQIWFIDHSRSFDLSNRRPKMMKKHTIKMTHSFKNAIEKLTNENLYTLKPWLHRKQIKAIKDRRRKMLKNSF